MIRSCWPFALVLVIAAGLRLYALDQSPLWTDELFSLQSTAGRGFWVESLPRGVEMTPATRPTRLDGAAPLAAIYWSQGTDTHPPIYYWLLRLWREAAGDSIWMLRIPSVACGVGMVAAISGAGWACGGRSVGIWMGLLAAVASPQITYAAQEARGYALALLFVAVAAAALVHIRRSGLSVGRSLLLGISAVLALGTLYLTALPLAAMVVFCIVDLQGSTRRRVLGVVLLSGVISLLLWGPLLSEQSKHLGVRNSWLLSETPRTLATVAPDAAIAVVSQLAPLQERSYPVAYVLAGLVLIGLPFLYRFVPASRLWVLWLAITLAGLVAMDLAGNKTHLQIPRYTLLLGPALIGILATVRLPGQTTFARIGSHAIPAAALLLCVLSLGETYRGVKEDWFILRDYIRRGDARPTDLYVVAGFGGRRWDHILYLGLCRYAEFDPLSAAIVDRQESDLYALRLAAIKHGGLVVILEPDTAIQAAVPEGWRRTAVTGIPTVGTVMTFRPDTTPAVRAVP